MRNFFRRAKSIDPERSSPGEEAGTGLLGWMKDESGAIMIETVLCFMVMITMVLGIIECSIMAYTYSVMEDAAREGVRYATVHGINSPSCNGPSSGCDATAANVVSDVRAYAGAFTGSLAGMNVAVNYLDGASTATSRVRVTVSGTYQPVFHFPETARVFSVSSEGRILY